MNDLFTWGSQDITALQLPTAPCPPLSPVGVGGKLQSHSSPTVARLPMEPGSATEISDSGWVPLPQNLPPGRGGTTGQSGRTHLLLLLSLAEPNSMWSSSGAPSPSLASGVAGDRGSSGPWRGKGPLSTEQKGGGNSSLLWGLERKSSVASPIAWSTERGDSFILLHPCPPTPHLLLASCACYF